MRQRDEHWVAQAKAAEVVKSEGITSLPVDPFAIARRQDIECFELPAGAPDISGFLSHVGDLHQIFYSTKFSSEGFRRFTVAHELGHFFLPDHVRELCPNEIGRHQSVSGFASEDKYEREADTFAAHLLMPTQLFTAAFSRAKPGLAAIEKAAAACQTSLTATAIRYVCLSADPVSMVCTFGDRVRYAFMSESMKAQPNITWIRKDSFVPKGTVTATFNADASNVSTGRRDSSTSNLEEWFDGDRKVSLIEEVVGLGSYGCTLTVLVAEVVDDSRDEEEERQADDDDENMLPSDRWRRPRED